MPTLCLLRHAKAAQPLADQDDFDRPLTERGRNDAARAAEELAALRLELALVSAAVRTRETWEIVNRGLSPMPQTLLEAELYLSDAPSMLARIRAIPKTTQTVLIVGHNPGIHETALLLAGRRSGEGASALQGGFPTCSLAIFSIAVAWNQITPGSGRLQRFVTARSEA